MQSGQQRFEGISLYAVEATRGYAYPPISWQLPTVLERVGRPPTTSSRWLSHARGCLHPGPREALGHWTMLYVAWPARATRDANASRQLSSALGLKT
jgi:hypothetical protein